MRIEIVDLSEPDQFGIRLTPDPVVDKRLDKHFWDPIWLKMAELAIEHLTPRGARAGAGGWTWFAHARGWKYWFCQDWPREFALMLLENGRVSFENDISTTVCFPKDLKKLYPEGLPK